MITAKTYVVKAGFILFMVSVFQFSGFSQTGPAGVGQNVASVNQVRFWLKADVGVYNNAGTTLASNGNRVQQWNDQSGLANHAVQNTLANRPYYATNMVNGLPALRFLGSHFVTAGAVPGIANNVGYTYSIVFRDTAYTAGAMNDGAGDYLIDRGPPSAEGNPLSSLKITNTNKYGFQKRDGGGGGLGGPVGTSIINTAYHIINYRQTPGGTKVYDLFYDNALEATVSNADANYTPQTPQIGRHYSAAAGGIKGYIAEVILYNYNVNAAQINILNSSLAAKYGLTLASADKYAGDSPGNGDYDFEVAGIGTEASGNNLSASSSVSGGLEATQNTAMGNGEYLVYGHNSGNNTLNTTDVGGMSAGTSKARWERIWYLDWTHIGGSNETANLIFDYSDAGTGGAPVLPLTNYKLLYRAGTSGNWTEVMNASSIAGDRVTFTGVAYNAASATGDGYYTIGTLDAVTSPLPLELVLFEGQFCESSVCLNWATANESNTDKFIVQRSGDGQNWAEVGQVKAAGESHQVLKYDLLDSSPLSNTSYYRLKQIDLDQTYTYSKIISVNILKKGNVEFRIYPNPNKGIFTVDISGLETCKEARISLIDQSGKLIYSTEVLIENSQRTGILIAPETRLPGGSYECTLDCGDAAYSCKVIVN